MFRILRTRRKATRRAAVLLTLTMCAGIAGVTASMAGATETPAGLAATSVTDESGTGAVTVTWDEPSELMLSGEAAIGTYSVPVDPYDPVGTTFYGVEPGQHTVSLVLIDGGGDRSDAATVNVTVHPLAPGTPTVVEGHANGTNVTVTWSDDGSATSSDVTLAGQTLNVTAPTQQVVFAGVALGTHGITVTAKNGGGPSAPGTGSVVVTGDTTPGAPQNVASTDDADLSVRVSWDAPASDGGDTISEYRATLTFPSGPRCDDGDGGTGLHLQQRSGASAEPPDPR